MNRLCAMWSIMLALAWGTIPLSSAYAEPPAVDQYCLAGNTYINWALHSGTVAAQVFTAGASGNLAALEINLFKLGTNLDALPPLIVEVRDATWGLNGAPVLGQVSVPASQVPFGLVVPTLQADSVTGVLIDLAGLDIDVEPGDRLAFVLRTTAPVAVHYYGVRGASNAGGTAYVGGEVWLGSATLYPSAGYDLLFKTFVDNPDSDADGLLDSDEIAVYGTDPDDPDTDDDGLLDGTEVDMAQGGGCPSPTASDSDGDSLVDGAEVELGTNLCDSDTDADGVPDNIDPTPTVPGVTGSFLEGAIRDLSADLLSANLGLFTGPNANANEGRRNSLATLASNAANAIAAANLSAAAALLQNVLNRIDGIEPSPDWMGDSPEKTALAEQVQLLITLLGY